MSNSPGEGHSWQRRLLSGFGGLLGGHVLNRVLAFLQMSWYAHLFSPENIGFFLFVNTLISGYSVFSDWGIRTYMLKYRGDDFVEHSQTGLWVQSVISVALLLMIVFTSPLLGMLFHDESLPAFVLLVGITIISPFFMLMTTSWERNYQFLRVGLTDTLQIVTAIAVTTLAYYYDMGLLSLFIGFLSGFFARITYVMFVTDIRFRFFMPDPRVMKKLINFSLPMLVVSVCSFLSLKGDDLMVRYFWGDEEFGFYAIAFYLPFVLIELVRLFTQLTFPAFADRQFDTVSLRRAFSLTNQYVSVIAFPMAAFLYFLSEPLIHLFFGGQWDKTIPAMEMFTLAFILRAVTGMQWGSVALIRNRTRYMMWVAIATVVFLFVVGTPLIARFGMMGGVYYSLIQLGVMGPLVRLPLLKQELGTLSFFRENWPAMFSGVLAFLLAMTVSGISIYLAVAVFMAVYSLALFLTAKPLIQHGREFLQHSISARHGQ